MRIERVAVDRHGEWRRDHVLLALERHAHARLVTAGFARDFLRRQADRVLARGVEQLVAQHVAPRRVAVFWRHGRGELAARGSPRVGIVDHQGLERQPDVEAGLRQWLAEHDLALERLRSDQVIVAELLHRAVAIDAHLEARGDDFPGLCRRRFFSLGGLGRSAAGASPRGGAAQPARIRRSGYRNLRIGVFSKT